MFKADMGDLFIIELEILFQLFEFFSIAGKGLKKAVHCRHKNPIQLNLFGQNTWTALDSFENKYTL